MNIEEIKKTMQRERKFRFWDSHSKTMHCSSTYTDDAIGGVRPWIAMDWTGLTDKNGREIYEGDIYRRYNYLYVVCFDPTAGFYGVSVIRIKPGGNDFEAIDKPRAVILSADEINEVVGNIFENPELIVEQLETAK